jgi:hypothetical protein
MLESIGKYGNKFILYISTKKKVGDFIEYDGRTFIIDSILINKKGVVVTEI